MTRRTRWAVAALTIAACCSEAWAGSMGSSSSPGESVLINENVFVQGDGATTTPLYAPSAGDLSVTLTDQDFPSPFASLEFGLGIGETTAGTLSPAGTLTLDLTAPTEVYANIFWATQSGSGLYNLTATFVPSTPVPLPSSAVSLAGGVLLIVLLWTRVDKIVRNVGTVGAQATVTSAVV